MSEVPSSRLCVKNLPLDLTDQRLHQLFSAQGEITDAKIARTSNGLSRRFGFIGYRTIEQAQAAKKYFNKSYIQTTKISVEFAKPIGSKELERPWSKHAKEIKETNEEAVNQKIVEKKEIKETKLEQKMKAVTEDAELQDFLQIKKPRALVKVWSNDDAAAAIAANSNSAAAITELRSLGVEDDSDDEYDDRVITGVSKESDSESDTAPEKQENLTDMDWLKSKKIVTSSTESSKIKRVNNNDNKIVHEECIENNIKEQELEENSNKESSVDVSDTGRLFVRNLPFTTSEEELREIFSKFGNLADVHVPLDFNKRPKGYAYILFTFPEDAVRALTLDGSYCQGRVMHILPAKPLIVKEEVIDENDSNFKKIKEQKLKKEALNKLDSWNSFFIPSNAAVDAMANKLGVSKSSLLNDNDQEESNKKGLHSAVRVALSEAQVIGDTKQWLSNQGVNISAFEGKVSKSNTVRSSTTILLKNIPFSVTDDEIYRLFVKFGSVAKCLLPPTHSLAIVEFTHAQEARQAFKSLAYKRFKNVPLYLEWAPADIFDLSKIAVPKTVDKTNIESKIESEPLETESATLFVKNLNFDTTEESLKAEFSVIGDVRSVVIMKKPNTKTTGKDAGKAMLSMGYGFVEYLKPEFALEALKKLQHVVVDGHKLEIKISNRESKVSQKNAKRKGTEMEDVSKISKLVPSTKLLVKNLAFEATTKDLRQLFGTFGQIKSVRMPKKFNGDHRGFGFVDFVTSQEAVNALTSLEKAHLYGRHLVVEWANADDTIDDIRNKAAKQLEIEQSEGHNINKSSKKRKILRELESSGSSFKSTFGI